MSLINELIRLQNLYYLIRKKRNDYLPLMTYIDNMNMSMFVAENIKHFSEFRFKVYISQIDENNNK